MYKNESRHRVAPSSLSNHIQVLKHTPTRLFERNTIVVIVVAHGSLILAHPKICI